MGTPRGIDTKKTEDKSADSQKYGDASDLDVTHYMGNNENIPRERENEEEDNENIGKVAYGNVESTQEQQGSP